ncbi:YsnF/AvaK domain-containing protein [Melaminivora sp.]|uniref:YsnF/AvaK domain-containing protein n=1 Tax=Melaminivora sp. TaxID=1933032 RepID=UPI0028AB03FF|nr:YsnF/AvaK domain-containing protein [Melaminivora sp.]
MPFSTPTPPCPATPLPDDARAACGPGAPPARVLQPGESLAVPVVHEQVEIATVRRDEGAVRVRKYLQEHEETVQLPGWAQRAHVERVPVNQPADEVRAPRQEGDAWVVPVYEERWVAVRQLYLREELRITTVREARPGEQTVTLRREQVSVERADPVSGQWRAEPPSAPEPS